MNEADERLAARILAGVEVDVATGCWLWTGAVSRYGYGIIGVGHQRTYRVHRVSYALWRGQIPDEWEVHHSCERKLCANPDHLQALSRSAHRREHIAASGLRGFAAENAAAMTCRQGHPFDGFSGHQRTCSVCNRERSRRFRERRAERRR